MLETRQTEGVPQCPNLAALHEDTNMLDRLGGQDAVAKAARHRSREEAIARTGCHLGLAFTRPRKGFTACHLGDRPPGATALIDKYATRTAGVGAICQQLLSSVLPAATQQRGPRPAARAVPVSHAAP